MKCPICKDITLLMMDKNGVEIDYCPECRGIWLDRGELEKLIQGEKNYNQDIYKEQEKEYSKNNYQKNDNYHNQNGYKKKKSFLEAFDFFD